MSRWQRQAIGTSAAARMQYAKPRLAQRSSRDCRSSTSDGVCGRPSLCLRSLSQSRRKASLRRRTGAVPDSSLRCSSMIASLCALRTLDTIIHKSEDNRSCQSATTPILSESAARTIPDVTNGHPALSHRVDHSGAPIRVAAAGNSRGTDTGNSIRRNGQRFDAIRNAGSHGESGSNRPTHRWTITPRIRPTAGTMRFAVTLRVTGKSITHCFGKS